MFFNTTTRPYEAPHITPIYKEEEGTPSIKSTLVES